MAITMTDQSTGTITSRAWVVRLSGSVVHTSSSTNPTFALTVAGIYDFELTVTGPGGASTPRTRTAYVVASSTPLTLGAEITSLAVQAGATGGTYPYSATLMPLRGQVPAGSTVGSTDDATLRGAILSTWDDGSAAVVVVSGAIAVSPNELASVAINVATGSPGTGLTAAAITAQVTSVAVNFGGSYGSASITDFSTPERVWWATPGVICARYRVAAPTPGSTALEAVLDVHAWADRAFVEVVVENGRVDLSAPVAPAAASYTGATVAINGSTVATVNNPVAGTFGGTPYYAAETHEAFRAWYASGWIGGDPQLEVTHETAYIQAHPLLFKIDQASDQDLQTIYGSDAYVPWSVGRHRAAGMGAGGDHASIGALTKWDTQYLQSGNRFARRAVVANALACLSFGLNYRQPSGDVPSYTDTGARNRNASTWPELTAEPRWEIAHHPATGLMAFLCQPSPCFIELAQKVALWNGTYNIGDWSFGAYAQTRGLAWAMRSQAHAIFLTPDGHAWKAPGKIALTNAVAHVDQFRTASNNPLGLIWDGTPTWRLDFRSTETGWQHSIWQHMWIACEMHKITSARLLSGADQTELETLANWACELPVRQVNESVGGEWRYQRYFTTAGKQNYDAGNGTLWGGGVYGGTNQDSEATWGAMFDWYMTDGPPTASGPWKTSSTNATSYSSGDYSTDSVANTSLNYATHFWAALVAAVEREVPAALTAWNTVQANVTDLAAWQTGFAADPRQGSYPRSGLAPAWVPDAGKFATVNTAPATVADPCPARTCAYSGNSGFEAIWTAWNGGAYAPTLGAYGSLLFFGGGHYAYHGNEVVAYDIAARTWSRLSDPSPYGPGLTPGWTTNTQNLVLGDGIVDASAGFNDGTPYPIHTNMGVDYLPPDAGGGTLGSLVHIAHSNTGIPIVTDCRLWRFDLSLRTWSTSATITNFNSGDGSQQRNAICYDSSRKGIWIQRFPSGGLSFYSFLTGIETQVSLNSGDSFFLYNGSNEAAVMEYCASRDCIIAQLDYNSSVVCVDLSSFVLGVTAFAPTHTITETGTRPGSIMFDRLADCSRDGCLYLLDWTSKATALLYKLTPPVGALTGTWTWSNETLVSQSGESLAIMPSGAGRSAGAAFYGRFRFVPPLKSFAYHDGPTFAAQLARPVAFT
jgi:hypothetical protein